MDEELVEADVPSVGERLRAAREEKKMSLEDIAAQTRIPQRHLESIERSEWDKLPAPTYTIGFARSYATCVGLDRTEISDQLRTEIGGSRPTMTVPEVFEPADPARTMPKSLVFGAIAAVLILILVMTFLNKRSLDEGDEGTTNTTAATTAPAAAQPTAPASAPTTAGQPVVLTATDPVWLQVYEKGGATLFSGMLQAGQTYAVPPTATAPLLKTGKPEALRISVGNTIAPTVGPTATTVNDVSLLPADLLKTPAPQATPPAPALRPRPQATATPPPPAAEPSVAPTNNATGE
jgi:transcriptional regulator with XRE-family HTH domain